MYNVISRKEAARLNYKHFYTGLVCKHGHKDRRFTSTGGCVQCGRVAAAQYTTDTLRGDFCYPLHRDDRPAALAYCQALDMARGRTPHVPRKPIPTGAELAAQANMEIADIRKREPEMLRQLDLERNLPPKITDEMKRFL